MPDKKMNLHKELAMGLSGAKAEANTNYASIKNFKKGGVVKKASKEVCPECGRVNCACGGSSNDMRKK